MPFYSNSDTLYAVFDELFRRTLADPTGEKALQASNMVFRLDVADPGMLVTVNAKSRPADLKWRSADGRADLVIHSPADLLHQVCLKEVRLRDAFFGGKMKVEGSILRARRLEGLFHVLQAHYPQVLEDSGILKD